MTRRLQFHQDMQTALKAGDKSRLGTLRLVWAAIRQREVDERIELDDGQVLVVLEKMLKQCRDAAAQFEQAGRDDLAAQEHAEITIIEAYLPTQLGDAEQATLIDTAIAETGAKTMREMGQVMAILKQRAAGRVDMGKLSARVRARLN